ncbi:MAG: FliM/FliN family flagellar motor switch protein [Sphingorhabdus sp.]|uniref:FliM/FliN family flagellar motor switch protein n=1 Tax=Sphingorhabdus sp. TaxID=1902408 RepID=UPI003C983DA2
MRSPIPVAEKLDLVAATSGRSAIAENGFSSKRLGIECAAWLERSGLEPDAVEVAPTVHGWQLEQPCVQFACRNDAGKACAIILVPMALFERLFVHIYGGDRVEGATDIAGGAQRRYARRLGVRLCEWLASAWPETARPRLTQSDARFDPSEQEDARNCFDAVLQLGVDIMLPGACSHIVHVAITPELLSTPAPQQTKRPAPNRPADWLARMIGRAGHVPLPVRSEIAGISMPASRLLALQPGDVLPIAMPKAVPVLVGGQRFASASMGEFQGNAALRVETLNESNSA